MSADNWTICPRCHQKWREPKSVYGKVSEEKYLASLSEPKKAEPETLREDWSIAVRKDGYFEVRYHCTCTACGFSYSFETCEAIKIE